MPSNLTHVVVMTHSLFETDLYRYASSIGINNLKKSKTGHRGACGNFVVEFRQTSNAKMWENFLL
jgi:hypothetical protein